MSKQKKTKSNSITFEGFGGVDRSKGRGDGIYARDTVNFRILKNGSLAKRQGFKFLTELGGEIRAHYSATVNGMYTLYLLISDTVYTLDLDTMALEPLGSIGTVSGSACMFHFREGLYLADSEALYEYKDGSFTPVIGYVPLIAENWPNDITGEIHEPPNILNRHARATFVVADPPSPFLCVGGDIESVEAVYVNHSLAPTGRYHIDHGFGAVVVLDLKTDDYVEVYFTYMNGYGELYSRLCSSTLAALIGGIGSNRIFLGGNGSGTVFGSENVKYTDLALSQKHYPDSNSFYFPLDNEFDAGNGINRVEAILRHNDRLIIFTEADVWMVSPDEVGEYGAGSVSVNARLGCSVSGGAVLGENDIFSVGDGSVWRWTAISGSQGGYKAEAISAPIEGLTEDGFFESCGIYYDHRGRELWLYSRSSPIAWIYGIDSKSWYSFSGFSADDMLDLDGCTAFFKGSKLFVFEDGLAVDIDEEQGEHIISASYKTEPIDFGTAEFKNLSRALLRGDLKYTDIILSFETDRGETASYTLCDRESYEGSLIETRLSSGRFKHIQLTLSSPLGNGQKIQSLTLSVR